MADRYWVGGSGAWNSTNTGNWSTSSGGATGASVPTASDDVFFDAASSAASYTVTISSNQNCYNISWNLPSSGVPTFTGSATRLTIAGVSAYFASGLVVAGQPTIWINATVGSPCVFDSAGVTFPGVVRIVQGGLKLASDLSLSYSSSTNYCFTKDTTSVFDANGMSVYLTGLDSVVGTIGANFTGDNSFYNLIKVATSKTHTLSFACDITVSGLLTCYGDSTTNRLLVASSVPGATTTLTANSITTSNCDFRDITFSGAASPASGTSLGNAGGNSGITFTTLVTRYAKAAGSFSSTSVWSATSGGSTGASVPLCHDTVIFDANTAAGTYTCDIPRPGSDFTANTTGVTLSFTIATTWNGSFNTSGLTLSGTSAVTLAGRGNHTLSCSATFSAAIVLNIPIGTYTVMSNMTFAGGLSVIGTGTGSPNSGTFDANDYNITFTSNSSLVVNLSAGTVLLGNGIWTINLIGFPWLRTSGCTLVCEGSTLLFTGTGTSSRSFNGGGATYNIVEFAGSGTQFVFSAAATIGVFKATKTIAYTINFSSSSSDIVVGDFQVSGSVGKLATLSGAAGNSLTKSGGGVISCDYLNVSGVNASPANTFYAGTHSTNTSGSGWTFTDPPGPNTSNPLLFGSNF